MQWIEEKEDAGRDGDVLRAGGVGVIPARLKMLAGIVIEHDGKVRGRIARAGEFEDKGLGEFHLLTVARQGFVEVALQVGLGDVGIFRSGLRKEAADHLIEDGIARRISIAEADAKLAEQ